MLGVAFCRTSGSQRPCSPTCVLFSRSFSRSRSQVHVTVVMGSNKKKTIYTFPRLPVSTLARPAGCQRDYTFPQSARWASHSCPEARSANKAAGLLLQHRSHHQVEPSLSPSLSLYLSFRVCREFLTPISRNFVPALSTPARDSVDSFIKTRKLNRHRR